MHEAKKIKVLVIDDSLLFREIVVRGISNDKGIEVVAMASNPFEARDKILEFEPDVLTLDIEMPKMSGIEFLKRLMPQYPIPVVVVSALSDTVFEALNLGAVDFVTKPNNRLENTVDGFINELIVKIKIAAITNVNIYKNKYVNSQTNDNNNNRKNNDIIIAMGASTGGTEAIFNIIKFFSKEMPGIVIVQHMPPRFTKMYSERLNASCKMEVKEAEHGDIVVPGKVLIAPGDKHMKINKKKNSYIVECFSDCKVNGHRPAVDVLFNSVAESVGSAAIGIILTGMGCDGAKGLLKMKENGAITIGQDEKSCVVYGMPKVAYDIGAVLHQVSLRNIPENVYSIVKGRKYY